MPISRIKTDGIQDDAITSAKIGVDVIVADDLAANSVTVSEITDGAVTGAKLANNLNYDSGTLYLDSTNNRVGIGTSSPAYTLQVGEGNGQMSLGNATSGNGASRLKFLSSNTQKNWQISTNDNVSGALEFTQTTTAGGTTFATSPAMIIDSSGNMGIGVTPSAWSVSGVLQSGRVSLSGGANATGGTLNWNAYYDGSWKYKDSLEASQYNLTNGQHVWSYAGTGTADGAITWSEAMRIDSAGNVGIGGSPSQRLLVANTSSTAVNIQLQNNTASNLYIGADTTNLVFYNGGSERLRIDSSGNVGIGTASPNNYTDYVTLTLNDTNGGEIDFEKAGTVNGSLFTPSGTSDFQVTAANASGNLRFSAGGYSEAMRILSGGQLVINSTTLPVVGTEKLGVNGGGSTNSVAIAGTCQDRLGVPLYLSNTSNTTNTYIARFATGSLGSTRGEIYFNGSALVYATSSDYRLKQNINYDFDATTKLKQLKPAEYRWIEHQKDDIGFLAHEVQEVFPNAVGGEKDEVNADGSIKPQTYDPSKLVPLLVKTIQELEARITALESN